MYLSVFSAEPGCRGSPEAAGCVREGQRRCEVDEHRQQAESGPGSDTTQTTEGKDSCQTQNHCVVDHVHVCVRQIQATCEEHEEEADMLLQTTVLKSFQM